MSRPNRVGPGFIGKLLIGASFTARTLGETALLPEELAPLMLANNPPDPQLKLVNAIGLLFAGSLSMLVMGYVFDSARLGVPTGASGPNRDGP